MRVLIQFIRLFRRIYNNGILYQHIIILNRLSLTEPTTKPLKQFARLTKLFLCEMRQLKRDPVSHPQHRLKGQLEEGITNVMTTNATI